VFKILLFITFKTDVDANWFDDADHNAVTMTCFDKGKNKMLFGTNSFMSMSFLQYDKNAGGT